MGLVQAEDGEQGEFVHSTGGVAKQVCADTRESSRFGSEKEAALAFSCWLVFPRNKVVS